MSDNGVGCVCSSDTNVTSNGCSRRADGPAADVSRASTTATSTTTATATTNDVNRTSVACGDVPATIDLSESCHQYLLMTHHSPQWLYHKAQFPLPELTGDRFPLPVNTASGNADGA